MAKIKQRHYFLATKAFPINKKEGKGNSGLYDSEEVLSAETHNLNLGYLTSYLNSISKRVMPNPEVVRRLSEVKSEIGYGNRKATNDHELNGMSHNRRESYFDSTAPSSPIISPNKAESKLINRINFHRNQIKRLEYLKNLEDPGIDKTPKYIKSGTAFGIEIECYVPLSMVGINNLKIRCLNCTSCADESVCHREPDNYLDQIRDRFKSYFKRYGIKNVQIVYDGSLDSNGGEGDLSLYCGIEFRVLCNSIDNFENLKKLCSLLEKVGARVDSSCGLHVHLDMRHADLPEYLLTAERLNNSLFGLKMLVPNSRIKDNRYCEVTQFNVPVFNNEFDHDFSDSDDIINEHSMNEYLNMILNRQITADPNVNVSSLYRKYSKTEILEKFKLFIARLSPMKLTIDKYVAINTHCFKSYKTIEVRLHSGTTSFNKIVAWINVLKTVSKSKYFDSDNIIFKSVKKLKTPTINDFLNLLNSKDTALKAYIIQRHKKLQGDDGQKLNSRLLDMVESINSVDISVPTPPIVGNRTRSRNSLRNRGERTRNGINFDAVTRSANELVGFFDGVANSEISSLDVNAMPMATPAPTLTSSLAYTSIQDLYPELATPSSLAYTIEGINVPTITSEDDEPPSTVLVIGTP